MADEPIGCSPCFVLGIPNDEMDAQTEFNRAAEGLGALAHRVKLQPHILERFTPGQIGIDMLGCDFNRGIGRAAKPEGRRWLLHRWEIKPRAFYFEIFAFEINLLAAQ